MFYPSPSVMPVLLLPTPYHVALSFTFVIVCLLRSAGRRLLFIEGGVQLLICQIIVGCLVAKTMGSGNGEAGGPSNEAMAQAIIAFICIYVAGFAWSWGPLGWLVPSEIHPLETRAAGMAVNTCVNFLMSFVIGQCFLSMMCSMKFGVSTLPLLCTVLACVGFMVTTGAGAARLHVTAFETL